MTSSIPQTMKALVTDGKGWFKINQEHKVPSVKPGHVLVKTKAVALNPADWKFGSMAPSPNFILGSDLSGEVVGLGEGVSNVKVGDRVAAWTKGGSSEELGAFAQYVLLEADLVWKVPQNISWEEAAALGGGACHTPWQVFYTLLNLPSPLNPLSTPAPLLIWGGSSSVGMYAIQLARASGFQPIVTASPKNHEYLKSIGAEAVFDFKDEKTPKTIKEKYPGIKYGLDCITANGTTKSASLAMEQGTLVTTGFTQKEEDFNQKVEVKMTILYTALGQPFQLPTGTLPARPEERAALVEWNANVWPKLLADGVVKSNPLRKGQGFEAIPEGLTFLKNGKNSAEKLVYTV